MEFRFAIWVFGRVLHLLVCAPISMLKKASLSLVTESAAICLAIAAFALIWVALQRRCRVRLSNLSSIVPWLGADNRICFRCRRIWSRYHNSTRHKFSISTKRRN
jgi:hypothetical protein